MPLPAAFKGLSSLVKAGQSLATGSAQRASQNVNSALGLPIGIDFGTGSLKVLQIAAGEPLTLVGAGCAETPDELRVDAVKRLEFQAKALVTLVKAAGFKNKRAACAIPAWATVCKHMQLSKPDGQTLTEQINQQLPLQMGCDAASVVHRHLDVTPPGASKPEVIVMAVSRELIARLMQIIKEAKLEPVGMHSEFLASLAAYEHIHRRAADAQINSLYLDIGAGTTTVAISHGKKLAFVRSIDFGGCGIDQVLAAGLGCSLAEARKRRWAANDAALPPSAVRTMAERAEPRGAQGTPVPERRGAGDPIPGLAVSGGAVSATIEGVDLSEPLDILADEVRMCMRFHTTQFPSHKIERLIFLGGESRHRLVCQHVARAVKLEGQVADPFSRIGRTGKESVTGVDLAVPQPAWAVALGVCLSPTDL
ncbi:MAG: pilus assembly protein PilM [Planctomycetota bacterium]|nr:pilus assembly protein PilM [Planctomycetota bacterium]